MPDLPGSEDDAADRLRSRRADARRPDGGATRRGHHWRGAAAPNRAERRVPGLRNPGSDRLDRWLIALDRRSASTRRTADLWSTSSRRASTSGPSGGVRVRSRMLVVRMSAETPVVGPDRRPECRHRRRRPAGRRAVRLPLCGGLQRGGRLGRGPSRQTEVVLAALDLGGGDGLDLFRRVRELQWSPGCYLVALVTNDDEDGLFAAMTAGRRRLPDASAAGRAASCPPPGRRAVQAAAATERRRPGRA